MTRCIWDWSVRSRNIKTVFADECNVVIGQVAPALTDSIAGANPVLTQVNASDEMNLWSMAIKGGLDYGCLGVDVRTLFLHLV